MYIKYRDSVYLEQLWRNTGERWCAMRLVSEIKWVRHLETGQKTTVTMERRRWSSYVQDVE